MTQFIYLFNILVLVLFIQISKAQDNNFVPPILVTCAAVPDDTGGTWDCHPPNILGYPVHTGTICYFICNGTSVGANICSNLGKWDTDPEKRTCEDGAPSTTLSSTTRGSTVIPTTMISPPTTTVSESTTMETTTTLAPTTTTNQPSTSPTQPTTNTTEPSTTLTHPTTTISTTISTEPSTTHPAYENCPFNTTTNWKQDRSLYCPQSYCPAVFIASTGPALENQPDSIGCFNYEGSLMADEYPIYINRYGRFLTPHAYSNPVIGYTVWLVSDVPMDTNGTIRNNKHDDMFCPYDMHDGWEYMDTKTGLWVEDTTLTVNCVKA